MPMDWQAHRLRMVAHFLMMEAIEPTYARWSLVDYCKAPGSPFPKLHMDVVAEKARRAAANTPSSSAAP